MEQRALLGGAKGRARSRESRRRSWRSSRTGCRPGSCSRTCSASAPNSSIAVRTIARLAATVQGCPGWPMPGDLHGHVRAGRRTPRIARFQPAMPSALRSAGRPVWLRMICVSGKSAASRAASARCHHGVCRSKRRPLRASARSLRASARRSCRPARRRPARDWRAACGARCARTGTRPAARAPPPHRRVQPGLRDRDGRQAVLAAQLVDVAHLADRVGRVPLGFDVDRLLDHGTAPHRRGSRAAGSGGGSRGSRRSGTAIGGSSHSQGW